MIVELIGKRLLINGYVYLKGNTDEHRKVTWKCNRYRRGGCRAKFVTSDPAMSEKLLIYRGIAGSQHNHDPSIDEIREAEGLSKSGSKRISWELLPNYPSSSERDVSDAQNSRKRAIEDPSSAIPRKKGVRGFMNNPNTYREFLVTFAQRPIFDRYHIMEAVKNIYKSDHGRISAYAKVLENQEKIMRDLDTIRNDPKAPLTILGSQYSISHKTNCSIPTSISVNTRETNLQRVPITCISRTECAKKISQTRNQGEIIPPVPAAIPIIDLLPSEQDIHPIRPNEVNVKKEIVLVDLTDDSNVKQEKNSSGIDQRTQSIQGNGSTNTPENSLNRSSNSVGVEIPMVGSSHPNLLHEQTLKAFFPQIYSQNQPSTNINFQNLLNCSGHQPVNHTSANPDVTVPNLIPVVISIPYMKSDGTTEMKQVFSHLIQINPQTQAQPVESQQPQGSIK